MDWLCGGDGRRGKLWIVCVVVMGEGETVDWLCGGDGRKDNCGLVVCIRARNHGHVTFYFERTEQEMQHALVTCR